MNESSILCTAVEEGADCLVEASMIAPVPLCVRHQLQIALVVIPDVLTTAVRQAGVSMKPVSLAPDERAAVIAGALPKPVGPHLGGPHGPVVYFIENGNRVKIGHSTNLRNRVRSLSLQEKDVALLLQGGLTLERALHATYGKERIDSTEWFTKSERMVVFIASKRAELGGQRRPQHLVQKRVTLPAPAGTTNAIVPRGPAQWAALAAPLYQRFIDEHGNAPSASALVDLLRLSRPDLVFPKSDRWDRKIRMATGKLIERGHVPAREA